MSSDDLFLSLIVILSILSLIFTLVIIVEKSFLHSSIVRLNTLFFVNQRVFRRFRENLNDILAIRQVVFSLQMVCRALLFDLGISENCSITICQCKTSTTLSNFDGNHCMFVVATTTAVFVVCDD